jgi:hypothetical protein
MQARRKARSGMFICDMCGADPASDQMADYVSIDALRDNQLRPELDVAKRPPEPYEVRPSVHVRTGNVDPFGAQLVKEGPLGHECEDRDPEVLTKRRDQERPLPLSPSYIKSGADEEDAPPPNPFTLGAPYVRRRHTHTVIPARESHSHVVRVKQGQFLALVGRLI